MVPVNPPLAVAVSVTGCAAPPAVRVRLGELNESEKSGVAPPPPPPLEVIIPLQPQKNPTSAVMKAQSSTVCAAQRKKPIVCILGGKCRRWVSYVGQRRLCCSGLS